MSVIFVTGAIGSGKTYFSRHLADVLKLPVVELDGLYFDLPLTGPHREKKEPSRRDWELARTLDKGQLILEGWHFGTWLVPMYRRLSAAVILDVPLEVREKRIRDRFRRRKSGDEPDPFPMSGADHLDNLLKWTKLFDVNGAQEEIRRHAPDDCEIIMHSGGIDDLDVGRLSPRRAEG